MNMTNLFLGETTTPGRRDWRRRLRRLYFIFLAAAASSGLRALFESCIKGAE